MFPSTFPQSVNDLYFGYVNLIEFVTFIFIRTRSSIKFFPKMITILNITFLVYINSYPYAAMYQYLAVLQFTSLAIFFYFIKEFEQPAMMHWNPFDIFTPRIQAPRIGY